MSDWPLIAWRFGLYLDLLLLFGLAAYPLYGAGAAIKGRTPLAILAVLGLFLSGGAFLAMTAEMAGVSIGGIDADTLRFVALQTAAGAAFLLRLAALIIMLASACASQPLSRWLIPIAAAAALATLAWTGHAAVTEGVAGIIHRTSDIAHLLAAGAWIGALAILFKILIKPRAHGATQALAAFATTGSIMVASIVVTGLVNILMIVGLSGLLSLPATPYGKLLLVKLALFTAMLAFAAANRWRLTPRLAVARTQEERTRAARALRISIALEASAAIAILALVAWFGTLAPVP